MSAVPMPESSPLISWPPSTPLVPLPSAENALSWKKVWKWLRRDTQWTLGEQRAAALLLRWGLRSGLEEKESTLDPRSALKPLADVQRLPVPEESYEVIFEAKNSFEAAEAEQLFGRGKTVQCWFMTGFLTGFMNRKLERSVYFFESHCVAKGDQRCIFVGKTREEWEAEVEKRLSYYDEDDIARELAWAQEQLKLTRDRYQTLFEESSFPILIVDPDTGACRDANVAAEDLSGVPQAELLRKTLFDLCRPEDHHRLMSDMKSLGSQRRSISQEITLVRPDDRWLTVDLSLKMLTFGSNRILQAVLRDITVLKASEQKEKDLQHQLLRSERLSSIGQLAAGVAHELKNPLGAIRNAMYYIRGAVGQTSLMESDPHLKEVLQLAESEIDQSVVIIGELLDFSRVVQLVPRKTSINELLETLPSIVVIPNNIALTWDLDVTLPSASVDSDRLNQVFCNITNNACQAMPQGGTLFIGTKSVVESAGESGIGQEMIEVTIEDSGCGIDALHLSKIFEPLFTTKARGTGLGLAISSNIIEKHGGTILVNSQVGKGTRFTVKLPLQPPPDKEDKK